MRQIEPEKLKVLRPRRPAARLGREEREARRPFSRSVGACIEWGSFTLADAARAELALEPLALGARLAQRRTEEQAAWWVFIPSQGSRQAR